MALEMESMMDYESAIEKRIRVKELLDENDKFIPACKQLMKIAYLHGEMNCDYDKCSSILADVVRRILERSPPLDLMPLERLDLLIQCYHMGAICYSKARKWNEAIQQYGTLLPIIARTKGVECQEYNSASIQMAALLVKTGQYDHALNAVIKYFDLAEKSSDAIVDDSDHILALDVYSALLL
jgi:tetratricopeptide (TPR) repeat protein